MLSLIDAPVGTAMTKGVKTIGASRSLADCVRLMSDNDIGEIVVVENDKPVGIFTERDLVRKMADGADSLKRKMTEVMSKPLTTILPKAAVWDAITLMGRKNIRRLPVVESGKLVGMLTERDVFRIILSHQNLLLEVVSESIPVATRGQLQGIVSQFGVEKPPTR